MFRARSFHPSDRWELVTQMSTFKFTLNMIYVNRRFLTITFPRFHPLFHWPLSDELNPSRIPIRIHVSRGKVIVFAVILRLVKTAYFRGGR